MIWKKHAEGEYFKPKEKYSMVRVWKVGLSSFERKRRGINTYGFAGRIGRSGIETKKFFKKKSEANLFASNYMKKY